MTAPTIWIIIPAMIAFLLLLTPNRRFLSFAGGITCVILAVGAQFIPIDQAMRFGSVSIKIDSSLGILGRSLVIQSTEGPLMALIYGATALWFFGTEASNASVRFIPLSLLITAAMIASIAVEPFLFAALFIELAVLISVPLLAAINEHPGRGVIRFLIYQTLAVPFILLSGWLLAGVEASPGNLQLASQSAVILGMGFAFLLAVFPLYNWMPLLMEDSHPFVVGFLFWIIPTTTILLGTGFIDRYSWLRTSPQLTTVLQLTGLLMVVSGGLWAAFQNHIGRIMAYASAMDTGFALLALSLDSKIGIPVLFLIFPAKALGLVIWSLSVTLIKDNHRSMVFNKIRGTMRTTPFAAGALILTSLSTSGFPLLAGFPPRIALWDGVARASLNSAFWMGLGMLGMFVASFRMLAVLSMADELTVWTIKENWIQIIMLVLGIFGLFLLGLFPQLVQNLLIHLPSMFEHLGN